MGPPKNAHNPPSQPPTPPSTPLSPKTNELNKYTSNIPFIPNLTITQTSSLNLPQNSSNQSVQKGPLNLGTKKLKKDDTHYVNGSGLNLSQSRSSDYSYATSMETDLRQKLTEDSKYNEQKNANSTNQSTRVSSLLFLLFTRCTARLVLGPFKNKG